MIVNTIQCPLCSDIIYSRARYDLHWCGCGNLGIDGGFDYVKISYNSKYVKMVPAVHEIDVAASKKELYDDWNTGADRFGIIKSTNND